MANRKGEVTFKGEPFTLLGGEVKVGDMAPDAELVDNDMKRVRLSSYRGNACVICSVPSLDTPVCDMEARRFNEEAAKFGAGTAILTISRDLPFAQKRWCGATGAGRIKTLSDFREGAFGRAWGLLIEELGLLARAVFVVDGAGKVRYAQLVKEITEEPNYDEVLRAVKGIAA